MKERKKTEKSILVVGAGPAGLMAAAAASEKGCSVAVLEQNDKSGRKLLATGNGRCNYTNRNLLPERYHGNRPGFQNEALRLFNNSDVIRYFEKLGVVPDEKDGWVYPRSHQASSVLQALLRECRSNGVRLRTETPVREIRKDGDLFRVVTESGWEYTCHSVILACGSCASSIQGSSGSGYEIASKLGHSLISPSPALVPLKCKECLRWDGVRTYGTVALYIEGILAGVEAGELQLTEYGISGIPVFQISGIAVRALSERKKVIAVLDFLPEMSVDQLISYMEKMQERYPDASKKELLSGILPEKLCQIIMDQKNPVNTCKEFPVTITGSLNMQRAQVCQGGVDTSFVDPKTMGSLLIPGLFFAGELLDIDGPCGGYNLQWAWSSGRMAGNSAAAFLSGGRS